MDFLYTSGDYKYRTKLARQFFLQNLLKESTLCVYHDCI